MTDIDQIKSLGLEVGDTVTMHISYPKGGWTEYRRTLLWHGERVAVWATSTRSDRHPWAEPVETASPLGDHAALKWVKAEPS